MHPIVPAISPSEERSLKWLVQAYKCPYAIPVLRRCWISSRVDGWINKPLLLESTCAQLDKPGKNIVPSFYFSPSPFMPGSLEYIEYTDVPYTFDLIPPPSPSLLSLTHSKQTWLQSDHPNSDTHASRKFVFYEVWLRASVPKFSGS